MLEHFQLCGHCLCVFEVPFCKQNSCHIFDSGILRLHEPFYYDDTSPNCLQMPYDIYHTWNFSLPSALLLYVLRFYQGNLLRGIDNVWVRLDLWCKLLVHKKARDNSFSNNKSLFQLKSINNATKKVAYGKKNLVKNCNFVSLYVLLRRNVVA